MNVTTTCLDFPPNNGYPGLVIREFGNHPDFEALRLASKVYKEFVL